METIKLTLDYDQDCECPVGMSGDEAEKIISFSTQHRNFEHPDSYFEESEDGGMQPNEKLRKQLESQEAFLLSYHEHGNCMWGLQYEVPECRWDTVGTAGIYWLPSDVHPDNRVEYARGVLKEYTDWCNGQCFWYSVEIEGTPEAAEAPVGATYDSCGGYIGHEYFEEEVKDALSRMLAKVRQPIVNVTGQCKDLANGWDFVEMRRKALEIDQPPLTNLVVAG